MQKHRPIILKKLLSSASMEVDAKLVYADLLYIFGLGVRGNAHRWH